MLSPQITEYVLTPKHLMGMLWVDTRADSNNLILSEKGIEILEQVDIKKYRVVFDNPNFELLNKDLIRLGRYITCPFYWTQKEIYVYSENMAIQLVLFGGNIKKYLDAKDMSN